jgi:protein-arginine kinase activator protein McsA
VRFSARDVCVNGHAFTPENTKIRKSRSRSWKVCRECRKASKRKTGRTRQKYLSDVTKHRQMALTLYPSRPKGESKRLQRKRSRERIALFVIELKNAPCVDCGNRFHHAAMDFDHLPGFEKRASVSRLAEQVKSKSVILAEVAKCDLVCANCHRVRTYDRARLSNHRSNPGEGHPATAPRATGAHSAEVSE